MYNQFLNSKSINILFLGGMLLCTDVIARGIDIPKVNWIVQFTPPQDPAFYIHRIGRTARAGNIGHALIFILPTEESYINFLQNRNIPINKMDKFNIEIPVIDKIKDFIKEDRDIYDKSISALTAFIRAYKNHKCRLIFRFVDINIPELLKSFGIIKLPRMPELNNKVIDYVEEDIDTNTIPYKDAAREKARQIRLKTPKPIKEHKEKKPKFKKEKPEKRKRKKKSEILREEWNEFAEDTKLYKKLRKGKITYKSIYYIIEMKNMKKYY